MITEVGTDIFKAKTLLESGSLVSIPTETVYGLAANAFHSEAIEKIYVVKNRPRFNPLILHVRDKNNIKSYVQEIPEKIQRLIDIHSPGPVTFLLPKSSLVSDLVTAGSNQVAIRIPNHPMTLDLLSKLSFPLVAPSANISGFVSPTSAEHCMQGLFGKIPYVLDGGLCNIGLESTIVGYDFEDNQVLIHRLGGLSIEEIEKTLEEEVKISIQHSHPNTPGQLKSHYATKTPLKVGKTTSMISQFGSKNIVVINLFQKIDGFQGCQFVLSVNNSISEAAQNLFSVLRLADDEKADLILIELAPNYGLGPAINDRLQRAEHHHL